MMRGMKRISLRRFLATFTFIAIGVGLICSLFNPIQWNATTDWGSRPIIACVSAGISLGIAFCLLFKAPPLAMVLVGSIVGLIVFVALAVLMTVKKIGL